MPYLIIDPVHNVSFIKNTFEDHGLIEGKDCPMYVHYKMQKVSVGGYFYIGDITSQ